MLRAALLFVLLVPPTAFAGGVLPRGGAAPAARIGAQASSGTTNINTRYDVESAAIVGVAEADISAALRDDVQTLVGKNYDPDAADRLAERLRAELRDYRVTVKVTRGEQARRVRVVFEAERIKRHRFDLRVSPLLYSTNDGASVAVVPSFDSHDNHVSFGYVTTADDLLERNTGWVLRYEHRRVGTSAVQIGLEYDYFHPSFRSETEAALGLAPRVPGVYRTREVFSPSVSVLPVPDIKVTFGASFETLAMQYPASHDEAAHAATFGVQYRKEVRPRRGLRHSIGVDYALRDAGPRLSSDFTYTRQRVAGDYALRVGRQGFAFRLEGGRVTGTAPLYERFSLGSATRLRGWDKLDVAPLGGTRLAYGSLAYHYRPFEVFYDVGAVWEAGQERDWKHSVGVGLAWRNGFFMSIGVPLRYHGVTPAFLFGFRR